MWYYRSRRDDTQVIDKLTELAEAAPEFLSWVFVNYCEVEDIEIKYIQPGKPSQNGYIERFNRTYREDVLDAHLFRD